MCVLKVLVVILCFLYQGLYGSVPDPVKQDLEAAYLIVPMGSLGLPLQ